ncbi:hypothetical protein K7H20_14590 [Salipiger manganoxidans]|uniref:hypothetical protein n=1 Tax=Salipiger marinus TaxID=555512 RepID=UPI000B7FFD90|nr:hypothetical protein [Salipiger manganoxidans]MCD1619296.1 hypothetical protein [Salipiger manganoxidans]
MHGHWHPCPGATRRFLRPVIEELNDASIKADPKYGAHYDHLFIFERDTARAEAMVADFIERAKMHVA